MKPKPIFTIGFPSSFRHGNHYERARVHLQKEFPDYHIICYPAATYQFQAFYDKDFKESSLEEIKSIISAKMEEVHR